MRKVDLFRQLQDIDTRTDTTRLLITRLTDQLSSPGSLAERRAEAAGAHDQLRTLEAQQRDLELQAEDRRAKIKADEGKLYSGRVTNPKELASLSDEVDQDKRQLSAVEDKLIDLIDRTDEAKAQTTELDRVVAAETRAWDEAMSTARTKLAEAKDAATALERDRAAAAGKLVTADLAGYDTLRRQKAGLAVSQVKQRTCQACRVTLTPVQEQRARIGADLVTCHSCGRFLFVSLS